MNKTTIHLKGNRLPLDSRENVMENSIIRVSDKLTVIVDKRHFATTRDWCINRSLKIYPPANVLVAGYNPVDKILYTIGTEVLGDIPVINIKSKYSSPYQEICDKIGNPIDSVDSFIQLALKEGETQNLIDANEAIENLKTIFSEFRNRGYLEETKEATFSRKDLLSIIDSYQVACQLAYSTGTVPDAGEWINNYSKSSVIEEIELQDNDGKLNVLNALYS